MDLATAREAITQALEAMQVAYYRPVFDEWAIVAVGARHGGIVTYRGFRAAEFVERFQDEVTLLRRAVAERPLALGGIVAVRDAHGAQHDVAVRIGERSYLVLNNTTKRMAEMSTDPRWAAVQPLLDQLGQRFSADPLEQF